MIREAKDYEPSVGAISLPPQKPGLLGALGELDDRVVAPLQRLGGLADRRPPAPLMSTHDEHELVQGGCEVVLLRDLFAPTEKRSKLGAEREEARVLPVVESPLRT
jgi:hypothetical protein